MQQIPVNKPRLTNKASLINIFIQYNQITANVKPSQQQTIIINPTASRALYSLVAHCYVCTFTVSEFSLIALMNLISKINKQLFPQRGEKKNQIKPSVRYLPSTKWQIHKDKHTKLVASW